MTDTPPEYEGRQIANAKGLDAGKGRPDAVGNCRCQWLNARRNRAVRVKIAE